MREKLSYTLADVPANLYLYLLAVTAIGFTIDGGIYSVLLNLYLLRLGYGPEFVGTVNSAGLLIFAAISLPIGSITRWSSRQLLILGMGISFVGVAGLPLAEWFPPAWQAPLLIGMRMLGMVGLSFFFVHCAPYLMGLTPDSWHSRALSWQTAALSLAGFLGGVIGGLLPGWLGRLLDVSLSSPRPYQYPLMLAAVLLLPAIVALWWLPETAAADDDPAASVHESERALSWQNGVWGIVGLVLIVRVLLMSGVGIVNTFTNVYFDDGLGMSTERIGWLTALGRLFGIVVALAIPYLVDRFGNYRLVIGITLLSAVGMMPIVLTGSEAVAGWAFVLVTALGALRYLAFLVYALSLVSTKRRSLMAGTAEMGIGFSFAAMAFLGGYMIVWYGYQVVFLGGALLMVLGVVAFWLLFQESPARPRRRGY
ncbi:MAG: MFS transporter [Anaerolineales bacterium]|nr:MFS transporter [Anaerolineales bacterium]